MRNLILATCLFWSPYAALAGDLTVAVASNFAGAMQAIADAFEAKTGHELRLSIGATGKHYAQIINGAPFDVFFAADAARPQKLEQRGLAQPGSRFTYALGRLVLWSPDPGRVDNEGAVLAQDDFRFLAIANPRLAPYGQAARQVLETRGLWQILTQRMVRGENLGQTYQYIQSGNAELGFVAYSQITHPGGDIKGSWWEVPRALYSPIEQQAVLLSDNQAARALLAFVHGEKGRAIICKYGYRLP